MARTSLFVRPQWSVARLAIVGGALLALIQPFPYAVLLAINNDVSPSEGFDCRPSAAFGTFWGDPVSWFAVLAFTVALALMLARVERPSGAYAGGTIAVSLCAYLAVVAIVPAIVAGDPGGVVWLLAMSLGVYGTAFLCIGVAALVCWWARGRT